MKKTFVLALLGASVMAGSIGCKKYEDGPTISFVSRKDRVSNTWEVEQVIKNGDDITTDYNSTYPGYKLDINKNGSFTISIATIISINITGSWTFQSNDEELKMTAQGYPDVVYIILRLKQTELWLKEVKNGDTYEYHLKQA